MNVKRRIFVFGTMCLLSVLTLSVALFGNKTELFNGILASENPYSIVFETSKNKLAVGPINPTGYSGSGVALAIISYFRKEKKLMLIKNIVLIILTLHLALLLIIAAPQVVMY